ncbi:hypothetical protein I8748_20185 [Nostoc sp. CENA67]|uniref:Uncharacterized protein n=1 Tax=Amazonocrinis nigriterrae CENA67 TaxID=2794033 RepID=A0A8J7L9I5_9NOST|nr:hypothetical protein [Amazonocrinis nigriterrae]MBH8564473.1 hypothetical protein [Amazonocrinis nigriterrae CENA67]
MRLLRHVWQDIRSGQNLDIYITAPLSLVVAIFGVIGIANQSIVSAAILTVLALLLSHLLVTRNQNEQIQIALSKLEINQSLSASQLMTNGDDISEIIQLLRQSKQAYFWGTTFTTHIPLLQQYLEFGLASGLEAKFLLVQPSSNALKMAAFRAKDVSESDLNNDLLRNIRRLDSIAISSKVGKLEIKVIDYLAPHVMYIFDPHLSSGQIIMRLSTLRVPDTMRPIIKITRSQDLEWFNFYVEQFEIAWQMALPPTP